MRFARCGFIKVGCCAMISILVAAALSCGSGSGSTSPVQPGDALMVVAGNWQITTKSSSGATGTAAGVFQQKNTALSGTLTNLQSSCASIATVTGQVKLDAVNFSLNENGQNVTFQGKIFADQMSGTYSSDPGGCTSGDSGSWTAQRFHPVTGTWAGTLKPSNSSQTPLNVSLALNQDVQGNVTGTATFANSACLNTAPIISAAPIAGPDLNLNMSSGGTSLDLTAKIDASATTIDLTFSITGGVCDGETGTGILKH